MKSGLRTLWMADDGNMHLGFCWFVAMGATIRVDFKWILGFDAVVEYDEMLDCQTTTLGPMRLY